MSEREAADLLGEPLSGMEAIIAEGPLRPVRRAAGRRRFATAEVYRAFLALHHHHHRDDG